MFQEHQFSGLLANEIWLFKVRAKINSIKELGDFFSGCTCPKLMNCQTSHLLKKRAKFSCGWPQPTVKASAIWLGTNPLLLSWSHYIHCLITLRRGMMANRFLSRHYMKHSRSLSCWRSKSLLFIRLMHEAKLRFIIANYFEWIRKNPL